MFKRPMQRALPLLLILALAGCSAGIKIKKAKVDAEAYFGAIRAGDLKQALTFYDETFFAKNKRPVWLRRLEGAHRKLGPLEATKVLKATMWREEGSGRETFFAFKYKVNYQKADAEELITLRRHPASGRYKITAYSLKSGAAQISG